MASIVGNPTGATSAERLTGGKEAPSGGRARPLGPPGGGARRAAQEGNLGKQKEQYQSVRQQAVARAASSAKGVSGGVNAGRSTYRERMTKEQAQRAGRVAEQGRALPPNRGGENPRNRPTQV